MSAKNLAIRAQKKAVRPNRLAASTLTAADYIAAVQSANATIGADWDRASTWCALKKQGTSAAKLARENELAAGSLNHVFARPWPRGEEILATALGLTPQQFLPSRFNPDGTRRKGLSPRPIRRTKHFARALSAHN